MMIYAYAQLHPRILSTHVSRPMPIWMRVAMALLKYFKKVAVETLPDSQGQLLAKIPSTIVESNRQVLRLLRKKGAQGNTTRSLRKTKLPSQSMLANMA